MGSVEGPIFSASTRGTSRSIRASAVALPTGTVIGAPVAADKAAAKPDASTASDELKTMTRWPVTVSYYDRDAKRTEGEQTPVYAMSFELYENGVSRSLVLDYNDFVIAGALGKFDVKDSKDTKPCSN